MGPMQARARQHSPAFPTALHPAGPLKSGKLGIQNIPVLALEEGKVAGIDPEQAKAWALAGAETIFFVHMLSTGLQ